MIHERYKKAYGKEAFVEQVVTYIDAPSTDRSKMPGAVRNFNLMPRIELRIKDRETIADYFYKTEFAEPAWFAEHMKGDHKGMRDNI